MMGLCFALLLAVTLFVSVESFQFSRSGANRSRAVGSLSMGFMDILNKALANDPSLPPPVNPGLSNMPTAVEVKFLPSGKKVKAYLGQNIGMIAKAAGQEIKYSCKKGECGTCTVNFNGALVKACQANLPASSKITKFEIGVPTSSKDSKGKV